MVWETPLSVTPFLVSDVVLPPAPLPLSDFKEMILYLAAAWCFVQYSDLFEWGLGQEGVGLAQRCYVASGIEPWLWM